MTGGAGWAEYQFAVLRVVPHVHRAEFTNVGVVVHSRTAEYLKMRAVADPPTLRRMVPDVDADLLARYLDCYRGICEGAERAGEIALLSRPERFHWLSSPRSDPLQSSPVHEGIAANLDDALEELFTSMVGVR